ncbi:unnamed protein product [Candidula unifasciata]|uniref:G-protein coupled receptors family 1 profile domain-containing protein n=1 Tax=Candidula unifasciata TaxID=100452 RepID=A0A8S4A173_9EUPU|nr:unnamed protein product [Candidula unifasciata]
MQSLNLSDESAVKTQEENILVNEEMLSYFTLINTWGIGQCVTILGLIVNGLNIVVFVKQGTRDSVNISLLGLSISDFGSLFFHFFANLCWTPSVMKMDLPFYPHHLMYYLVWEHIMFTRVTTGTTAWITLERCLCIVAPLKIKSIVTPRRTVTFIVVLYVIMMASVTPMFYTTRVAWMFDPRRNKSLLGVYKTANTGDIEKATFWSNNILPTIFFIFITVCTIVLVKALKKNAKWRGKTSSQKQGGMSNRDSKVVKMVTIISIVFISCYAPGTVVYIFLLVYPQLSYRGKQRNLLVAIMSILIHLEAINATANFFIYLAMSSKFKSTFRNMFCAGYSDMKEDIENTNP